MNNKEEHEKYIQELKKRNEDPIEKERIRKYFDSIEQEKLKKELDFIFKENPSLEKIGTKEQYKEYLQTIFPNSKLKGVFWHGTRSKSKFDKFNLKFGGMLGRNFGKGVYAAPSMDFAERYAQRDKNKLLGLILDVKDPIITCAKYKDFHGAFYNFPQGEKATKGFNNDSIINYEYLNRDHHKKKTDYLIEYTGEKDDKGLPKYQYEIFTNPEMREVVVSNPSQVHILGSNKDLKKFYKFVHKEENDSLEKKVLTSLFFAFSLMGLIFSTNSLTGNVIGMNELNSNFTWPLLLFVGIFGLYLTKGYKK